MTPELSAAIARIRADVTSAELPGDLAASLADWALALSALEEAQAVRATFYLELREPHCVPERKGPFAMSETASVLREFFAARPSAYITVITIGLDGPLLQDGPECLQMTDGRSMSVGRKHIESSSKAHENSQGPTKGVADLCSKILALAPAAGLYVGIKIRARTPADDTLTPTGAHV